MTDEHHRYEVHLATDAVKQLDVSSPVETDRIDYYDSGLWVGRPDGRDFFPYHQVLTIRERPAGEQSGSERDAHDVSESHEETEEHEERDGRDDESVDVE
jgi:hypothetical protein